MGPYKVSVIWVYVLESADLSVTLAGGAIAVFAVLLVIESIIIIVMVWKTIKDLKIIKDEPEYSYFTSVPYDNKESTLIITRKMKK